MNYNAECTEVDENDRPILSRMWTLGRFSATALRFVFYVTDRAI